MAKRRTLDKDKILNYVNSKADSGLRTIALAVSQRSYILLIVLEEIFYLE